MVTLFVGVWFCKYTEPLSVVHCDSMTVAESTHLIDMIRHFHVTKVEISRLGSCSVWTKQVRSA